MGSIFTFQQHKLNTVQKAKDFVEKYKEELSQLLWRLLTDLYGLQLNKDTKKGNFTLEATLLQELQKKENAIEN